MDKDVRMISLRFDLQIIGYQLYFPIALIILGIAFLYLQYYNYRDEYMLMHIRKIFGVIYLPSICTWIFSLYQELTESDGKECLLSLPYKDFEFGLYRIFRITLLYIILFFFAFSFATLLLLPKDVSIQAVDFYLPLITILYFSILSFCVIVVTKNVLISYLSYGAYCIFLYMTRGGYSASVYPFHWSFPKPGLENGLAGLLLLIVSVLFCFIAHHIFSNREFLLK